jgi:hypothetical protein
VARQKKRKTYQKTMKTKRKKNETKVCYGSSDNPYVFVATIKEKKKKPTTTTTTANRKEVAFAEVQYNKNNNSQKRE